MDPKINRTVEESYGIEPLSQVSIAFIQSLKIYDTDGGRVSLAYNNSKIILAFANIRNGEKHIDILLREIKDRELGELNSEDFHYYWLAGGAFVMYSESSENVKIYSESSGLGPLPDSILDQNIKDIIVEIVKSYIDKAR